MNRPPYGIVEVTYDPVRELRRGLLEYRNQFCDVRLWVENHAIPAHKLILSLHSTFFQQMFKSDSESASDGKWRRKKNTNFIGIIFFVQFDRREKQTTKNACICFRFSLSQRSSIQCSVSNHRIHVHRSRSHRFHECARRNQSIQSVHQFSSIHSVVEC